MGQQNAKPGEGSPGTPGVGWLKSFEGHSDSITDLAANDKAVFSSCRDGTIRAWSLKGDCIRLFSGHTFMIECLTVLGDLIWSGSADHTIRCWSMKDGSCVQLYKGHTNDVTRLQVVATTLYSSSRDGTVRSWDLEKGEHLCEFKGHTGWIECFRVLNGILYTGSFDKTARSWDCSTGQCLLIFEGHTSNIQCLLLDEERDEPFMFTGGWDDVVIVWNTRTSERVSTYKGHHGAVLCLERYQNLIFSGSKDATVRSWNTESHSCENLFRGHTGAIKTVKIAEKVLYSASADQTIRAWIPMTGECIKVFKGHNGPVTCLLVLKDYVISGGEDKKLFAWKAPQSSALQLKNIRGSIEDRKSRSLPSSPQTSPRLRGQSLSAPNSPVTTDDEDAPPRPSSAQVRPTSGGGLSPDLSPRNRSLSLMGPRRGAKIPLPDFGDDSSIHAGIIRDEPDEAPTLGGLRRGLNPGTVSAPNIGSPDELILPAPDDVRGIRRPGSGGVFNSFSSPNSPEVRLPAISRIASEDARPRARSLGAYGASNWLSEAQGKRKIEVLRPE